MLGIEVRARSLTISPRSIRHLFPPRRNKEGRERERAKLAPGQGIIFEGMGMREGKGKERGGRVTDWEREKERE